MFIKNLIIKIYIKYKVPDNTIDLDILNISNEIAQSTNQSWPPRK